MATIIKFFWALSIMRVGPERAPSALFFMMLVWCADVMLNVIAQGLAVGAIKPGMPMSVLLYTLMIMALSYGVLALKGLTERFVATTTALLGADAVITFVSMPLLVSTLNAPSDAKQLLLAVGVIALTLWGIAVKVHIFYRAFNVGRVLSLLLAGVLLFSVLAYDHYTQNDVNGALTIQERVVAAIDR